MGEIIRLNTDFKDCPDNVFFSTRKCKGVKNHQCVPRPCRDVDCHLELENMKLSTEINEQKTLVRCLIIIAGILAAVCILLLIGAIMVRGRMSKKSEYSGKFSIDFFLFFFVFVLTIGMLGIAYKLWVILAI